MSQTIVCMHYGKKSKPRGFSKNNGAIEQFMAQYSIVCEGFVWKIQPGKCRNERASEGK